VLATWHWHIEISSKCTLRCPRCSRQEVPDGLVNTELDLAFFQRNFTPDFIRENVRKITFCGDDGDPIYAHELVSVIEYVKSIYPVQIVIVTNGSYRNALWWQGLGRFLGAQDQVHFSIDGYDNASNNLYRVNSNFDSIIKGIQAVKEANKDVFLIWATIIFKFNQDYLNNIVDQARNLDMDAVQWTRSTKFGSVYGGYGGDEDVLEPRSEFISKTHRYEREVINISGRQQDNVDYLEYNKKKYFEIKEQYKDAPITPLCEIGNRGVYVNAEGIVFPCSWLSFPYHSLCHENKTIQWKDSFFARHREQMSLHHRTFEEIIADPLWSKCSQGFTDPTKTWVECSQKCGSSVVDESYAVGWETN